MVGQDILLVVSSFAGVQSIDKAKRFSQVTNSLEIARPNAVRMCNFYIHIGSVDLMDSLVAPYRHSQNDDGT